MLVFGSSIGVGNYQPIPNEVISLQTPKTLTGYNNATISSSVATLNMEALSDGVIGKGAKAYMMLTRFYPTAAGDFLDVYSSAGVARQHILYAQVANVTASANFRAMADANGDLYIAPSTNLPYGYITVNAIQT